MCMKKLYSTLLFSAVCVCASAQVSPFRAGDRVAFVGNSITDGGRYHSYIWLYYMTRFPDGRIDVFNCGIGGDTAGDIYKRLDDDVFCRRPDCLVLTFGMNDTGYAEYNGGDPGAFADRKVEECRQSYAKIETRLSQLSGVRIVLMGSSPYDETAEIKDNKPFKGKNAAMLRVADLQRRSAADNGWQFVDMNRPMTAINSAAQQKDPAFALCGRDRIHPDNDGHMVMAYIFLRAQGFAGREVASVKVDAAKRRIGKVSNCAATNLCVSDNEVAFDYMAASLPYPTDTVARGWGSRHCQAGGLDVVPFTNEMNRETLAVTGLAEGDYTLAIDGERIGSYTAAGLALGVNLAAYRNTPQYRQALTVMFLNEERWEIERRLREYAWIQFSFFQPRGLLFADDGRALAEYDREAMRNGWLKAKRDLYSKAIHKDVRDMWQRQIDMLTDRIYEINRPVTRRITLTRDQ